MPDSRTARRQQDSAGPLWPAAAAFRAARGRPFRAWRRSGCPGAPGGDDGPMRIQANSGIEWQQDQRVYIARGNAVAARGTSEVQADTLIAHYREKLPPSPMPSRCQARPIPGCGGLSGEGGGNTEIYRVEAVGNVMLKREASTVIGDRAVYDIDQEIAVVTGKDLKLTTATDTVTARDSSRMVRRKADRGGARRRGRDPHRQDDQGRHPDRLHAQSRPADRPKQPPAKARRAPRPPPRPPARRLPPPRRARHSGGASPADKKASRGSAASMRKAMSSISDALEHRPRRFRRLQRRDRHRDADRQCRHPARRRT